MCFTMETKNISYRLSRGFSADVSREDGALHISLSCNTSRHQAHYGCISIYSIGFNQLFLSIFGV